MVGHGGRRSSGEPVAERVGPRVPGASAAPSQRNSCAEVRTPASIRHVRHGSRVAGPDLHRTSGPRAAATIGREIVSRPLLRALRSRRAALAGGAALAVAALVLPHAGPHATHVDAARAAGAPCGVRGRAPRPLRPRHLDRLREPVARARHRQPPPPYAQPDRAAVRARDELPRRGPSLAAELHRDDLRRDPGRHGRQQRPAVRRQHLRAGPAQRPPMAPLRVRHAVQLRPPRLAELATGRSTPRTTSRPSSTARSPADCARWDVGVGDPRKVEDSQRRPLRPAGRRAAPRPAPRLRDARADRRRRQLERGRRGRPGKGRRVPRALDPADHVEPRLPGRPDGRSSSPGTSPTTSRSSRRATRSRRS